MTSIDTEGYTIDMTPNPAGWAAIANTFADSIIRDVRRSRRADSEKLMIELVKIAADLGRRGEDEALRSVLRRLGQS